MSRVKWVSLILFCLVLIIGSWVIGLRDLEKSNKGGSLPIAAVKSGLKEVKLEWNPEGSPLWDSMDTLPVKLCAPLSGEGSVQTSKVLKINITSLQSMENGRLPCNGPFGVFDLLEYESGQRSSGPRPNFKLLLSLRSLAEGQDWESVQELVWNNRIPFGEYGFELPESLMRATEPSILMAVSVCSVFDGSNTCRNAAVIDPNDRMSFEINRLKGFTPKPPAPGGTSQLYYFSAGALMRDEFCAIQRVLLKPDLRGTLSREFGREISPEKLDYLATRMVKIRSQPLYLGSLAQNMFLPQRSNDPHLMINLSRKPDKCVGRGGARWL